MSRMRVVPQCIQEQHIQIAQPVHRLFRNGTVIGQVRRVPKPKAEDFHAAMQRKNWFEVNTGNVDALSIADSIRYQLGAARLSRLAVKNVGEGALNYV